MNETIQESVAKVLLVNERQEVLVLTVGEYKARPDKSYKPDLPGGLVDPGETELIAVKRELFEEAGITIGLSEFQLAYARTQFYPAENKSVSKFLYLVFIQDTPEVTLSWEHADYAWVPIDELTSIEFRPFYEEAVNYCFTAGLL